MDRKQNRKKLPTQQALDAITPRSDVAQVVPDITQVTNVALPDLAARNAGELACSHDDPEHSEILLAACRIVISGYKAEISHGQHDSLFVQAAYQLLHQFLERQFERNSRAAWPASSRSESPAFEYF
jgi:hypothetical protein